MKRLALALIAAACLSTAASAVSVGELASKCGDDAKAYCAGVGYGDEMTKCLESHRAQLKQECRLVVDRIEGGEKVSLF